MDIPVKHSKTVEPTTSAELHGLLVDTVKMEVRLPYDKLCKARSMVKSLHKKKSVTLLELQQVLGMLNFCNRVVLPGRPFLRSLIDLTRGVQNPNHHIRLNKLNRSDLSIWLEFLTNFNGVQVIKHVPWTSSNSWKFFSDASFKACAVVFADKWLQVEFPACWRDVCIAPKEMLPIALAFRMWAPLIKNSNVFFLCDNIAVVEVLKQKTTKEPLMLPMLRQMMVIALQNNIQFSAKHIAGKCNYISDMLSRLQTARVLKLAPWLQPDPVPVPNSWLPW